MYPRMRANGPQPAPVRERKGVAALARHRKADRAEPEHEGDHRGDPLYRRQPEYPGYLAIELVTDDELQLADRRPMLGL